MRDLERQARERLDLVREVLRPLCPESEPKIELSFDPPWTLQSITPAARTALGR